mgnify:CR=1 FL=1
MENKVIRTTWKETKHYIKGVFTLRDKSKTSFQIEECKLYNGTENKMLNIVPPVLVMS